MKSQGQAVLCPRELRVLLQPTEKPGASCSVSKGKTASSSTAAEEKPAGASCSVLKSTTEEKHHTPEVPKERCPSSAADEKQGLSCPTPTAKSSSKAKQQHSSGAKVKATPPSVTTADNHCCYWY
ncbi:hypothetical protein OS493_032427 [Desmophyllum pertusum]|uniref:Uncharacterized protein n=1 Tax=Desmophyllum pertusum TaxID=174260 RepID=A0A9W9ZWP2_9CNID|nr:hypothetical protein OS493_032427 [Desmophyllum pertusum]